MALDELLDEHEQGEKVRSWLKQNSLGLVGGLALGLALIGGGKWWMQQAHLKRVAIGESYKVAVDSLAAGDLDKAQAQAASLAGTAYEPLVALDLAKAQLAAGKRDDAIATLRAAGSEDPGLSAVIRQRLARLLVEAGQGEEALTLLANDDDAAAIETRGDARHALGRTEEARKDYAEALRKLDVAAPQRGLLELKLTQAGGVPETTGTES
ncbi:MAG TPA: tetratricopeptide repeat protein [Luteimonas sp.]|nr:tetratricopeptide repeat protein [Luteimonas sp.]HRO26458.1 tetratricopeptide repeat protein [Luteimonas sp.]HRP73519.1 tetratricopeptide repeat protein [Luteimonas sp.]